MLGDIIFVSSPNGAFSSHPCFGDSQWVAAPIVERGPHWRKDSAVMMSRRAKHLFIRHPPTPFSTQSVCMLCFVFVHPCLLCSCHHTQKLILALMPASTSSARSSKLSPRLPSATLLSSVAWWCHGHDQYSLSSICRRGRPFSAHYVALMRADSDLLSRWLEGDWGSQTRV